MPLTGGTLRGSSRAVPGLNADEAVSIVVTGGGCGTLQEIVRVEWKRVPFLFSLLLLPLLSQGDN